MSGNIIKFLFKMAFLSVVTANFAIALATTPGLPFTEDFTSDDLKNFSRTTADWLVQKGIASLGATNAQSGGLLSPDIQAAAMPDEGRGTDHVAIGDLDGDGDEDIVFSNGSSYGLYYHLNNGTDNPFEGVEPVRLIYVDPHAVALGDIDRDGDLDIVIASVYQNKILLNDGSSQLFSSSNMYTFAAESESSNSVVVADFNGDGYLDILTAGRTTSKKLYLNNTTDTPFSDGVTLAFGIPSGNSNDLAVADFNADGYPDIVEALSSEIDKLYLNNGDGTHFQGVSPINLGSTSYHSYGIAVGDLNGDGAVDVVAENRYYQNDPTTPSNPFSSVTIEDISWGGEDAISVAIGDIDSDGDLDVLHGTGDNSKTRIYLNNGTDNPFPDEGGLPSYGYDLSNDELKSAHIAVQDMDGDGDLDVVTANDPGLNRIYLNSRTRNPFDGSVKLFGPNTTIAITDDMVLVDLNADGNLDAVSEEGSDLVYTLGDGSENPFATASSDFVNDNYIASLTSADINNDGYVDIVAARRSTSSTNYVYLNNKQNSVFDGVAPKSIGTDFSNTKTVLAGDVNNDGHVDVVAINTSGTDHRLYINNGTTNPFTSAGITIPNNDTYGHARLIDFNKDGKLDLLIGSVTYTPSYLYINDGSATPFNTASRVSLDIWPTVVSAEDIDLDGDIDIVTSSTSGGSIEILYNDGSSLPFSGQSPTRYAIHEDYLFSYIYPDVNKDGYPDLVARSHNGPFLFLNNRTAEPFANVTAYALSSAVSPVNKLFAADIDNDGDIDVLAATDNENKIYSNQGGQSPFIGVDVNSIDATTNTTWDVEFADINTDGKKDLILANYGQTDQVYFHNGSSTPYSSGYSVLSNTSTNSRAATAGDVDGDGDNDIVIGNYSSQVNHLFINQSNGQSFTKENVGAEASSTYDLDLADIDQDGRLDLVVVNYSGTNRVYYNNGSSPYFTEANSDSLVASQLRSVKLADLDHDGDLDIATVGGGSAANFWHRNDGSGTWTKKELGWELDTSISVDVGDVNNDGRLDILVGNYLANSRLYINNPNAPSGNPFDVSPQNLTGLDSSRDVRLVDIDLDGDLDAILGNQSAINYLHLNNGTSTPFSDTGLVRPLAPDTNSTYAVNAEDIDLDGRIDVIVGNFEINQYLSANPVDNAKKLLESLEIDTDVGIKEATLTVNTTMPTHANISINWYLSNNGGERYYQVRPGVPFVFPATADELHWKAELDSLSSTYTPVINSVDISARFDHDYDEVVDDNDNCVGLYNPAPQTDTDGDNSGDVCDTDDDNDGVNDVDDDFPLNPTATTDTDSDGTPDDCLPKPGWYNGTVCTTPDNDDDNDGVPDGSDSYSTNHQPTITGSAPSTAIPDQEYSFILTIDDGYEQPGYPDPLMVTSPNLPTWLSLVQVDESQYKVVGVPSNDDYGTYSNINFIVSDGEEQKTLTVSSISVPDTRSPTTFAVPGTGNFNTDADVSLACFEDIGSGCATIYYKLSGDPGWSTHSGSNTRILIPASGGTATLQFYSEDHAGNTESTNSETYTFDTSSPVISINAPADSALLDSLAVIDGTASDSGTGVEKVELQVSGGGKAVQSGSSGQLANGLPDWMPAITTDGWATWHFNAPVWSHDTVYTITARVTDNAGNTTSTTHTFHYYDADPAFTTLDLNLSSSSVIYGGQVDASLKLTELGDPDADLSGSEVTLLITDPEYDESLTPNPGRQYSIGPFVTNADGQVTVAGLGESGNGLLPDGDDADNDPDDLLFDKKGTWTLQAQYAGNLALASANSQPQILLVGTSAGYAVIVEGRADNNEGLESHHKTGKRIYQTLLDRGFAEQNIFYFSYYYNDPDLGLSDANEDGTPDRLQLGVGMDGLPSRAAIQAVLQDQLAPLVAFNPAPIYLVMVDHGASDHRFLLGSEDISPTDINNWLTNLEADLQVLEPDALDEPRTVILGYCYSGGFIDELSSANRIIISSAAADEESYKGPVESDGVRVGEYFLEELFQELDKGNTFKDAFVLATNKTEAYTRSGGESANSENAYLDDAEQHPLLDDNGNGLGSNVLDVGSEDGQLASQLVLGTGPNYDTNSLENPAEVEEVTPTQFLINSENTVELWLKANDNGQVSQAYVEIRSPQTTLSSTGTGTEQLSANFTKHIMLVPGQDDGSGTNPYDDRFYINAEGLTEPGKYEVFYYVEDVETGNISPAKRSMVYKDLSSNERPTYQDGDISSTWDLLSPTDSATVKTAVIFDWEDARDPEGHALSYTLEIADTADFDTAPTFNGNPGVYRLEELIASQAVVDARAGLLDQETYYWRVKAIDIYGNEGHASKQTVSSQTWSFSTNNNNAPPGIIKGIIYSDLDYSRLAAANLDAVIGEFNGIALSDNNGEYLMLLPPGLLNLTTTKSGFANKVLSNIQVPVSTPTEPHVELNIQLTPIVDGDGDGVADSEDDFPDNIAASTDTDGDGQPDDWNVGCDASCQSSSGLTLDLDDDNDGMSDEYENANGLDPLVDDASGDLDNDGYTNFEEFEAGTAANDANDVPRKSSVILKILPLILNQ